MRSVVTILNSSQDVANEREKNRQLLILWPNINPYLRQAVKLYRYGSLININPFGLHYRSFCGVKFLGKKMKNVVPIKNNWKIMQFHGYELNLNFPCARLFRGSGHYHYLWLRNL